MNENTRKYYIAKGEEFEKASNYEDALSSYMEAFSVKECAEEDNPDFFKPGFIEDRIAFLAYRLGKFRIALTFGARAYRADESDERLKNNLPFYTDAILTTNPKPRLNNYIEDYLISNFSKKQTVLDVGPYDGYWSDELHGHFSYMDAVEAFEPYIERFGLKEKYDNVFISDIRNFEFKHYDIIILGDVLEHMPIEDAQNLLKRLSSKCNQLVVIVPYEYPQDAYDNNDYQIHHQEDLTDEIFKERYPGFELLAKDEVRGAYVKARSKVKEKIFTDEDAYYLYQYPKTIQVGLSYYNNNDFSKAIGTFENSLEPMSDENKALMDYYMGVCHLELNNTLEALRAFTNAVNILPGYRTAYYEIFKILEKIELWSDLEYYLKDAFENRDKTNMIETNNIFDWENLIFIQLTLALTRQAKYFEAYGYAALAVDSSKNEERKRIASFNFEELKKELWGTLQI